EATLIKKLEALGIGRPSTYAAILDNIMSRGYIREEKRQLTPTPLGERLIDALLGKFSFLEFNFTKELESALDSIAAGKAVYTEVVSAAYDILTGESEKMTAENLYPCPDCGKPMRHKVKAGKDGYDFWGCSGYPHCTATCADDNGRPGAKQEAKPPAELSEFNCEKCGQPLKHLKGEKSGRAYDFFACSSNECGATFDNVDGKPTARISKPRELTEHKCKKCGKPLSIYEGVSKAGKPYKKFSCSGYPHCRQGYWVKTDGSPDYDKPLN
ncbi:MAG: topoisomerase DNA-binding C4 zinc finger domain-containing protein, partial [Desulfovibrionaceae bacterium]|nr:topoisomerase DNA-binding C4 zinc finger domain-containing protein [Desulfovibrionaceae bacterium]